MSGKSSSRSESWEREASCSRARWGPGPLPHLHTSHTHIKGLTDSIVAAKNRIRYRDKGWVPFLPWSEVIISIILCLRGMTGLMEDGRTMTLLTTSVSPTLPGRWKSQTQQACLELGGRELLPPNRAVLQ